MSNIKMGLIIKEAAECSGIGRNTMRKLVDWGTLSVLKVGRKVTIRRNILERFMSVNQGRNPLTEIADSPFLPQYKGEPADGGVRQLGVKEMSAKPFTITDVGALLDIQRLSGGNEDSYNVVCPFCGDERGKCNFIVIKNGELVNVYHCFHCGAGGNMLTLYADLNGIYGRSRYQRAYWKIQEELPMDMQESKMREKRVLLRERRCKEQLAELVDYEKRDAIYREMLKLLKLSRSHRDDLRRRGLTEGEISRMDQLGYKSTCAEDSVSIARRLIKSGCNLKGVPGFFVNRNGDWEIAFYKKNSGYLCPVWSAKGCLTAFQIRLDVPYQKRKYVWLNSAKLNKGCSPGSPEGICDGRDSEG